MKMKPRLFLLFIFFLLYSATTYISSTTFVKLKGAPFYWSANNVHLVGIILTFIQFFSIFLGGFLAAFIIPVWVLLIICFVCLITAVSIFELAFLNTKSNVVDTDLFSSQNYVSTVVIFCVLFGIYSGMSKFILLVLMLDQQESTTIEDAMALYLFILNLSILFVYILFPSPIKQYQFYLTFSMPLILIAIILLLIGGWRKFYTMDSKKINIVGIIFRSLLKRRTQSKLFFSPNSEWSDIEAIHSESSSSIHLSDSLEKGKEAILSLSKLCIIFIILLPYGVCESQLRTTYIVQSNYLLQPGLDYYAIKYGFWVQVINCSGVIIFIPLFALLKDMSNWFKETSSKLMYRVLSSNLLIFLSILSAAIVETSRLSVYWGSRYSTIPSNNARNQIIDNTTYSAADMSVFYMTPQLLLSSISEILLITTCGQFMYQQSIGSIRYLSISFFLGAVGSGGAGDVISLGLTMVLNGKLFDPLNLNKRTFENGEYTFESRMDFWFYSLGGVFFLSIILSTVLLSNFKHFYEQNSYKENMLNNNNILSD